LRRDDILHNTVPVSGYEELTDTFKEYVEDQEEVTTLPIAVPRCHVRCAVIVIDNGSLRFEASSLSTVVPFWT
jgi:hypothetical protein